VDFILTGKQNQKQKLDFKEAQFRLRLTRCQMIWYHSLLFSNLR